MEFQANELSTKKKPISEETIKDYYNDLKYLVEPKKKVTNKPPPSNTPH